MFRGENINAIFIKISLICKIGINWLKEVNTEKTEDMLKNRLSCKLHFKFVNCIVSVMATVLASSVVDRGFEP